MKLITRWEYPNVTWRNTRTSSYLFTYLRLSIDMHWTGSSPIRHKVNLIQLKTFGDLNCNLTSKIFYSTLVCGLRIFAGSPIYTVSQKSSHLYILCNFAHLNRFSKFLHCWNCACVPQLFQQLINTVLCRAFLRKFVCQPLWTSAF